MVPCNDAYDTVCPVIQGDPGAMFSNRHHATPKPLTGITPVIALMAIAGAPAGTDEVQAPRPRDLLPLFEVQPLPRRPAWADIEAPPLFTFAWVSDMHLDARRLDGAGRALRFIREHLAPLFVVITGDNCAYTPPEDPDHPEPVAVRRQRFFKAFLDEHLGLPCIVIPGDNWPFGFEAVFGASQYTFRVGGLRLTCLALDSGDHRTEGLGVFHDATWQWLRGALHQHRDQPSLVLLHEPVVPPTFLDAERLRDLLDAYPNVLAGLHGHLHHDLQWRDALRPYLMCPALGPGATPGFKTVKVYRHVLILETYHHDPGSSDWVHASKWQRIDVPPPLRAQLFRPEGPFAMADYDEVPPHAHQDRPELAARQPELHGLVTRFLLEELADALANTR